MLITILAILLILGLALYATDRFLPFDRNIVRLIQLVCVIIAIVYIAQVAGIG